MCPDSGVLHSLGRTDLQVKIQGAKLVPRTPAAFCEVPARRGPSPRAGTLPAACLTQIFQDVEYKGVKAASEDILWELYCLCQDSRWRFSWAAQRFQDLRHPLISHRCTRGYIGDRACAASAPYGG